MRSSTLLIAFALACGVLPAPAQDVVQPKDATPSRYAFNRVDDGFLRLDSQSGEVAFCGPRAAGWVCQAVPEERAALEKEIARLQGEVARLKSEMAAPHGPPAAEPPASAPGEDTVKLHEDLARARVAFENAWRRLVDMIVNFQKDMMPKG